MTSATEERLTSISSEDSLDTHDANKRFPPYSRVSIVIPHVPISSPIIPIPLGTAPDPVFRPQYPIPRESTSDSMLRATKERLALTSGDDSRVSITFQQPSGPTISKRAKRQRDPVVSGSWLLRVRPCYESARALTVLIPPIALFVRNRSQGFSAQA